MKGDLKKVWAVFTKAERRKAVWMLMLVVLMAVAEAASVLSIMPFLSVLGRPAIIHENPWLEALYGGFGFQGIREFSIALGLASIVIVLASSVFKTTTLHLMNRFIHLQRHSISSRLLSRYLSQPYTFFLKNNPSVLSRNVLSEVDQLTFNLITPLAQLIAQGAVVLGMVLLIVFYDPVTAFVAVTVVGLMYLAIYGVVRKRLSRIGTERQKANGQRFQTCNETLSGIKDVKVTQAAATYQKKFERASRLFSRHMATSDTLSQSPQYLVEAVGYSGLIIIALALMLKSGDIAHVLPALGLYGFTAYRMLPSAQIMFRGFAKLRFSSPALNAIHLDLVLPIQQTTDPKVALTPCWEIRLEQVSYAYPTAPDKQVFDRFDITIPVGTSTGIIGKSGVGKSTLMDILLGLLQPQAGRLSVDGVPIDAGNVGAWQRAIGYVPQHIYLADASVAENIAFGVAQGDIDMQAVEHAARAAQIHDFIITELNHGYDTPIGDRGIRLSGGQRQRVGIARALYRDPPILFLDEATSALDSLTEASINQAVTKLSRAKTVVIIAHRKTAIANCDKVHTLTTITENNL